MPLITDTLTIAALWDALLRPADRPPDRRTLACREKLPMLARDAAAAGWVDPLAAEAVLYAAGIGSPVGSFRQTLALLGAPTQSVYRRPSRVPRDICGLDRISAVDLANAMMRLEEAGLDIDPAPLCEALMPVLAVRTFLTGPELSVWWYARERHRREPIILATGPRLISGGTSARHRTAAGYRAELFRDSEGTAIAVKVTAPRWRRRSLSSLAA